MVSDTVLGFGAGRLHNDFREMVYVHIVIKLALCDNIMPPIFFRSLLYSYDIFSNLNSPVWGIPMFLTTTNIIYNWMWVVFALLASNHINFSCWMYKASLVYDLSSLCSNTNSV